MEFETDAVRRFFDGLAPDWDSHPPADTRIIETVLHTAGVSAGKRVLDVACGTGVLFAHYLARTVESVTAVDLSPEMVKRAGARFPGAPIEVVCGDARELSFPRDFDCIIIFNAFPHFNDPDGLLEHLAGELMPGGRLTVAHGSGREDINACHRDLEEHLALELPPAEELAARMGRWLTVDTAISDPDKYIVSGFLEP